MSDVSKADLVTAIIPCRNEERYIAQCLDSMVAMDHPKDSFEVLVVDGMSTDGTRDIVERYMKRHGFIRLLDNPKKILAAAWNTGIRNARGGVIVALNAHTVFDRNYIAECLQHLRDYPEADYVGGVVMTYPKDDTPVGWAIACALSHPFGVGNSRFRTGVEKPCWSDTAAFGGYRKAVFQDVGLFNEDLVRSQDMEFHLRFKRAGKRILLTPRMIGHYYTRSRVGDYLRFCWINGFWATYPMRYVPKSASLRHLVPMIFVCSLAGLAVLSRFAPIFRWLLIAEVGAYAATCAAASVKAAVEARRALHLLLLPPVFAALHVGYGLGSVFGLWKAMWGRAMGGPPEGVIG